MLIFLLIDYKEMLTNLKAGNGYPCAGHIKLRVDSVPAENALILSFEANFGSALPIGSKNIEFNTVSIYLLETNVLPECWHRIALSRTCDSEL